FVNSTKLDREVPQKCTWSQNGTRHTLLTIIVHKSVQVGEVPKNVVVASRFCPRRQGLANLRNYYADLVGLDLDPREFPDAIPQPEFESNARHEKPCLITGLPMKRDRVIAREFLAKSLHNETDFSGSDDLDRRQYDKQCI